MRWWDLERSEIIGLKYSDMDFVEQNINYSKTVGKTPWCKYRRNQKKTLTKQELGLKTPSSYRTLKIPDYVFQAIIEQRKIYEKTEVEESGNF